MRHLLLCSLLVANSINSMQKLKPCRFALMSVSDKGGITTLAKYLIEKKSYKILSSGGTYKHLQRELPMGDIPSLIQVSDFTQFPEILDGRVKTLHPRIYGGLLAQKNNKKHLKELQEHNINLIDLIAVNLYPFAHVTKNKDVSEEIALENIDIGGHTLIRAAAKNYSNVIVLTHQNDYEKVMSVSTLDTKKRKDLAIKAWKYVANYDNSILMHMSNEKYCMRMYEKQKDLRYGLNPHQKNASMYTINDSENPFAFLNGKPGYINMLDINRSWALVYDAFKTFKKPCAASFKHTSPTGAAIGDTVLQAFNAALNADPVSAFGNIIAISGLVDKKTAQRIRALVSDGIIAPEYSEEALQILRKKKGGNFLIIQVNTSEYDNNMQQTEIKELHGGLAISQEPNKMVVNNNHFKLENIVTNKKNIPDHIKQSMILANIVAKYTESNSVVFAHGNCAIGIGAGQQNRVKCIELAGKKAQNWAFRQHLKIKELQFKKGVKGVDKNNIITKYIRGEQIDDKMFAKTPLPFTDQDKKYILNTTPFVMASDAFMPFDDNVEVAQKMGVKYIIQTGGSKRDQDVIKACNKYGITMLCTKIRSFNH